MAQTAEQKAASKKLREAIEETLHSYGYDVEEDGTRTVATDWIVAVAQQGFGSDGDSVSGVCVLMPDGEIPSYRALGLIECAHEGIASQNEFRGHDG